MPRSKTKKVRSKTRKSYRRRKGYTSMKGTLKYKGVKRFMRVCPFSNSANLTVAGTLSKTSDYMLLTSQAIGTTVQYGSFSLKFNLADIVNQAEFTSLFDRYRIARVDVKLMPFFGTGLAGAAIAPTSAQLNAIIHSVIDYDDITIPPASESGINDLRQFDTYKVRRLNDKFWKRSFSPRFATAVYGSGAFTSYAQGSKSTWIDCASNDVEHYGLKVVIENNNPGGNMFMVIKCEYTAYLEFKATR